MFERRKLESVEVEVLETDWLFGFVCNITLNMTVNGVSFTCEKAAFDVRHRNFEKELKNDFLDGKEINCCYNDQKVKLQYKDGWVYVSKMDN